MPTNPGFESVALACCGFMLYSGDCDPGVACTKAIRRSASTNSSNERHPRLATSANSLRRGRDGGKRGERERGTDGVSQSARGSEGGWVGCSDSHQTCASSLLCKPEREKNCTASWPVIIPVLCRSARLNHSLNGVVVIVADSPPPAVARVAYAGFPPSNAPLRRKRRAPSSRISGSSRQSSIERSW